MKYCINYYRDFRYINEIDEIIFDRLDNMTFDFIQNEMKQEQKVILDVTRKDPAAVKPFIDKVIKIHPNYDLIIEFNRTSIDAYEGYRKFFGEYCKTFDQVYSFINYGATNVYIVETLGFSLKEVGTYARERDVAVRVLPNVAQSTIGNLSLLPPENKFFIRPEDTDLYEEYVDVFELFGDVHKLSVTYEVYKDKQWKGYIGNLVKGLPDLFSLDAAAPFGEYRLNCGQKCYKCHMCTVQKELNNIMDQNNLKIVKEE